MALDRLPHLDDDGLYLPEVGDWAETKYRLLANYAQMFANAMKKRWDARVYVDLCANAGRARVKGSGAIIPTSAILAMAVDSPFDQYVFCDKNEVALDALRNRAERTRPEAQVAYVLGDCNSRTGEILASIPHHRPGFKVLSFCLVDPFSLAAIRFSTIRALATRFMDFMVLIPTGMDARRNEDLYADGSSRVVEDFLGDPEWRSKWLNASRTRRVRFEHFLLEQYAESMARLSYLPLSADEIVRVKNSKNQVIYDLAFFSRNELGRKFWREARKSSDDQGHFRFA
ncbi:MAG: three-Cys-motif partner protein TcmP [Myxococcota bacterium]|jgi:three-Cys-motif partner protein|nr:three-Cys-motif partner protein TcmP [Myxococcota bacterium]